jgi:hypothetical protein
MTTRTLSLDDVRAAAPSVFANNPFPGMSSRYAFVPTASVVEQMMGEGWAVRQASQSFTRLDDHRGFQKHMIRFARLEDIAKVNALTTRDGHVVNREKPLAEFPEVVMVNSHDGSSTYQLFAGIFRLVCSNGLIVADQTFASLKVRHTGDANQIIGASYQILESADEIMGSVNAMKQIELTPAERKQFALGGAMVRYGADTLEEVPVNYERLLAARRYEDNAPTLWNTFNTVQENLMKGGQKIRLGETKISESGRLIRPCRTKQIKAVDATVKVNKSLWQMAGEILAAKG